MAVICWIGEEPQWLVDMNSHLNDVHQSNGPGMNDGLERSVVAEVRRHRRIAIPVSVDGGEAWKMQRIWKPKGKLCK